MDVQRQQAPLLHATWPDFTAELTAALDTGGEAALKAQVEQLRIVAACSCDDDFCQSFHTATKLPGPYGVGHRNVCLDAPWPGYLILDVVHDVIVYVEVLYRSPLS